MTTASHFALHSVAHLRGKLVAVTPLHIGCGKAFDMGRTDAPILRDPQGRPYVPGSSLRGVLRAGIEAVLRAVDDRVAGLWACDPFEAPCVEAALRDAHGGQPRAEAFDRGACGACRVFGTSGFASRIWFGDLRCSGRHHTAVRDGVGIDRDLRTARDGVKFDYELLAAGAELAIDLRARNLVDWELGLVAMGLDLLDQGQVRLGGLGARGLGLVEVHIDSVSVRDAKSLLQRTPQAAGSSSGRPQEALRDWLAALQQRVNGGRR